MSGASLRVPMDAVGHATSAWSERRRSSGSPGCRYTLDWPPWSRNVAGAIWRHVSQSMQRSEEHTSELQSLRHLVCRLLLEKKKQMKFIRWMIVMMVETVRMRNDGLIASNGVGSSM